ncbi:RNA-binding domain-containing protein [Hallella seregens]|uniref:RNA-binding domain-containing protein n=1 Tax=Hallella seregens ATCC 51272 TaxID=1336250 RepID=A0ABV5ZMG7_9BACT|nr:RNA-binding domain-containing protein [Hallella seregens]
MSREPFDLQQIASLRENNRLEAKRARGGVPHSMWETYSAFANTEGGVILLGVDETRNHQLMVTGVDAPQTYIRDIWNTVNNPQKVSVNILTERMVYAERVDGKDIIVVEVPRADRSLRPVYLNKNPESGSYRRNFEGDYHCNKEQISAMYRDASEVTMDRKVLVSKEIDAFCRETIIDYRGRFKAFHPSHVWNQLDNEQFLRHIGAVQWSGEDLRFHPTLAGLLMFGFDFEILQELPQYYLDYREEFDPGVRWTHRLVSSSGDWSGNIYDFFWRVYPRLRQNLPVPFAVDGGVNRIDEPRTHLAIRELLLNALAHGDYFGRRGFVVVNAPSGIRIANPGDMRVSLDVALEGGVSDPRNSMVMRMFSLVGIGDRAGSGMPDAISALREELHAEMSCRVSLDPDRTTLDIQFGKPLVKAPSADNPLINGPSVDKNADKMAQILAFINGWGEVKTAEVAQAFRLSMTQSRYYLQKLIEANQIVACGGNRNRSYKVNGKERRLE